VHVAVQDVRRWRPMDVQLLIVLSCLHEVWARIDELELTVVDMATWLECAWEKLTYVVGVMAHDGNSDLYMLKLMALKRDETNELVKNMCMVLKGVVQRAEA